MCKIIPSLSKQIMEIRNFKIEDIEELIDLSAKSVSHCCTRDYSPEQIRHWSEILVPAIFKRIKQTPDNFLGIVSTNQSEVTGCCFIDLISRNVKCLYVKPGFTGQKIGKRLMTKIEEEIKEKNIKEIELDASINAVKFYESLGYSKVESDGCAVPEVPSIKMKKYL